MRIEQNNEFLLEILSKIKNKKLAKAPFNRHYAWDEKDVVMLFESIQKGYPIGNIITWTPDSSKEYDKRLGPIILDGEPESYIIDGHNRLATLAYSMASPDEVNNAINSMTENEENVWGQDRSLVYNGLTKKIYFLNNEELDNTRNVIPVGLVATQGFNMFIRKNYHLLDSDTVLENMEDLGHKIRETKLVNMHLYRATDEQAIDAFTHMAKTGQPMSLESIKRAKKWFLDETIKSNTLDM